MYEEMILAQPIRGRLPCLRTKITPALLGAKDTEFVLRILIQNKTNSVACSPQSKYTERAPAACRRN
jgi:hypothetical protein